MVGVNGSRTPGECPRRPCPECPHRLAALASPRRGNIEAFLKHRQATLTRVLYAARRRWLGVTEADFEQAASAQRAGTLPGREDEGIQRVPPWRGPGRP